MSMFYWNLFWNSHNMFQNIRERVSVKQSKIPLHQSLHHSLSLHHGPHQSPLNILALIRDPFMSDPTLRAPHFISHILHPFQNPLTLESALGNPQNCHQSPFYITVLPYIRVHIRTPLHQHPQQSRA